MHITLYIGQVHTYVLNIKNTVIAAVTDSYRSQFNSQLTVSFLNFTSIAKIKLIIMIANLLRSYEVFHCSLFYALCFLIIQVTRCIV